MQSELDAKPDFCCYMGHRWEFSFHLCNVPPCRRWRRLPSASRTTLHAASRTNSRRWRASWIRRSRWGGVAAPVGALAVSSKTRRLYMAYTNCHITGLLADLGGMGPNRCNQTGAATSPCIAGVHLDPVWPLMLAYSCGLAPMLAPVASAARQTCCVVLFAASWSPQAGRFRCYTSSTCSLGLGHAD